MLDHQVRPFDRKAVEEAAVRSLTALTHGRVLSVQTDLPRLGPLPYWRKVGKIPAGQLVRRWSRAEAEFRHGASGLSGARTSNGGCAPLPPHVSESKRALGKGHAFTLIQIAWRAVRRHGTSRDY